MANQKGETTSIGHFYNRCVDAVNNLFDTMSFWTHSKDVEFVDGKNAETKVGAINGITSDISGEADDIAASIKCVNELNNSLTKVKTYVGDDGKLHFIDSAGADSVLPFSTTGNYGSFTFDSSGNITITTDQEPTEVVALFKSKSSSTYNFQAYYNKNHTSMNVKISVSGNSFSINNNNSSGFGGSTGEYIWR